MNIDLGSGSKITFWNTRRILHNGRQIWSWGKLAPTDFRYVMSKIRHLSLRSPANQKIASENGFDSNSILRRNLRFAGLHLKACRVWVLSSHFIIRCNMKRLSHSAAEWKLDRKIFFQEEQIYPLINQESQPVHHIKNLSHKAPLIFALYLPNLPGFYQNERTIFTTPWSSPTISE